MPGRYSGAGVFPNYSPQVLARLGYAVLLHRLPQGRFDYPSYESPVSRNREVDDIVASLRVITDKLDRSGVLDSKRMGIMGWSYGGFLVPYIQTHYPGWFAAASMGEGGNHQPTFYWIAGEVWRADEDRYFGLEGPYGPNKDNWENVAPIFSADRMISPLLIEYTAAWLGGADIFQAFKSTGKQEKCRYTHAESILYRNR